MIITGYSQTQYVNGQIDPSIIGDNKWHYTCVNIVDIKAFAGMQDLSITSVLFLDFVHS